jgi:ABC-type multidrug transport system ATPase subunit
MASKKNDNGYYKNIDISWNSLNCKVCNKSEAGRTIDILVDVNGYANAGKLTAIMGPSGAGKTTLVRFVATIIW